MAYYRLYYFNGGSIISHEELEALDDVAAVKLASERQGRLDLELWRGSKLIHRIPAEATA